MSTHTDGIRIYQPNLTTYDALGTHERTVENRNVLFNISTPSPTKRPEWQQQGRSHIKNIRASASILTSQLLDSPRLPAGYNVNDHGNHAGLKRSVGAAITHLADDNKKLKQTVQELFSLVQLQGAMLAPLLDDASMESTVKRISEMVRADSVVGSAVDSRLASCISVDAISPVPSLFEARLLASIKEKDSPIGKAIEHVAKRILDTNLPDSGRFPTNRKKAKKGNANQEIELEDKITGLAVSTSD